MKPKKVNKQIQKLYTVPEILKSKINQQKEFNKFRETFVTLIQKLQNPSTRSHEIYDWLLSYIMDNIATNKGLIVAIKNEEYILKSAFGVQLSYDTKDLYKKLGKNLINHVISESKPLIIDDLKSNRDFKDCQMEFKNVLSLAVLSDSKISNLFGGYLIVIGDKKGRFAVNDVEKVKYLLEVTAEQLIFAELKNENIQKLQQEKIQHEEDCVRTRQQLKVVQNLLSDAEKKLNRTMWRLGRRIVLAILIATIVSIAPIWSIHNLTTDKFNTYALYYTIIFAIILIAMGLLTSMEIGPAKAKGMSGKKIKE